MKKFYITIILLLGVCTLNGQAVRVKSNKSIGDLSNTQLIRVKSAKSIDLMQGFHAHGFESSASFGYCLNNNIRLKTGFAFVRHSMTYSKFNRFQPYFSMQYLIYSYKEDLFIDAFATAKVGVQHGKNNILGKLSQLYIGESVGLSIEYLFFHYLAAGAFGSQDFYQLNDVNSAAFTFGLFISYNF